MLGFFIALFGGIFYGSKYLSEKAAGEAADRRTDALCESMKSDYDRFLNKMTDKELERHAKREAYSDLIEKVVSDLYAKAKDLKINIENDYGYKYKMVDICPYYRVLIIMASMGKLPYGVASFGISRPSFERDIWDIHALFMDWLDKELQSHGIEPMVFQSDAQKSMAITGVPVLARKGQMCTGKFGWWSMRLFL